VIVRFVDIDGVVDYHSISFIFIILNLKDEDNKRNETPVEIWVCLWC
jgi:hypothetical protein